MCAIDFQTGSVLALNKKTESELEISVFYLVPKHFRSEHDPALDELKVENLDDFFKIHFLWYFTWIFA